MNRDPSTDGDAAFGAALDRHRRELVVHCYRLLGAHGDAEDAVQETFLRAWRGRAGFEGRSTFRAWLYKIATNTCFDALNKRAPRRLPPDVVPAAGPGPLPEPSSDRVWIGPIPDRMLDVAAATPDEEPDAVLVAKETVELAFLAAIQHLAPRQRAALIMRDVLGWSANETAAVLGVNVPAAKSLLQRARAALKEHLPERRLDWTRSAETTQDEQQLLQRYIAALEQRDEDALVQVLSDDLRISFPPLALWYDGRDAFLAGAREHAAVGEYRFVPTSANLQPAVALYLRRPGDDVFRPLAFEVLRCQDGAIREIVDFSGEHVDELFATFELPTVLA